MRIICATLPLCAWLGRAMQGEVEPPTHPPGLLSILMMLKVEWVNKQEAGESRAVEEEVTGPPKDYIMYALFNTDPERLATLNRAAEAPVHGGIDAMDEGRAGEDVPLKDVPNFTPASAGAIFLTITNLLQKTGMPRKESFDQLKSLVQTSRHGLVESITCTVCGKRYSTEWNSTLRPYARACGHITTCYGCFMHDIFFRHGHVNRRSICRVCLKHEQSPIMTISGAQLAPTSSDAGPKRPRDERGSTGTGPPKQSRGVTFGDVLKRMGYICSQRVDCTKPADGVEAAHSTLKFIMQQDAPRLVQNVVWAFVQQLAVIAGMSYDELRGFGVAEGGGRVAASEEAVASAVRRADSLHAAAFETVIMNFIVPYRFKHFMDGVNEACVQDWRQDGAPSKDAALVHVTDVLVKILTEMQTNAGVGGAAVEKFKTAVDDYIEHVRAQDLAEREKRYAEREKHLAAVLARLSL